MPIASILMAAGGSRRLGRPKQLLSWQGESLVRRTARLAGEAGCEPVVVVTGAAKEAVEKELQGLSVTSTYHPNWEEGQGSSLQVGLQSLDMQKIQGLLLLVCDQPFLSLSHLQAMREAFESPQVELVASAYADTLGVPLLLSASLFPQLQQLPPHKGAQGLIFDTPEAQRRLIPFPKGEIDIDYPEDWEALNG